MIQTRRSLLASLTLLALSACASSGGADLIEPGAYYTQYTMMVDREVTRSTNYREGTTAFAVPVNTPVEVMGGRGNTVTLELEDDREFGFEHIARHTQDTMPEAFAKAFGPAPVDLAGLSEDELAAIERGEAIVGMDRATVLVAMGPPPAVGTLSIDSNVWKYWRNRFATMNVVFDGEGRVSELQR